jgi:lactate dehydrogenase-like 2-hydroxyacid dehydrogenase
MVKPLVALTRRLPPACEERLAALYHLRSGEDHGTYDAVRLIAHAANAQALIVTPMEICDAATIAALPVSLRIIASFSVGYEHIDLGAAQARGLASPTRRMS